MKYRIYFDPRINLTHLKKHEVSSEEINEFFSEVDYLDNKREDGSWVAIGKLKSGRYLQVIFREMTREELFIITAYDIENPETIEELESYLQEL